MMAQSIPNVPIPPKGFFKCWHPLSFSTSEQERTKLLKLSSVAKPFNSNHFCEIYLQLWKETAPFLGKKSFFHPCVALKCWKCFAIILHNVKYRHTVLSTFMTHTYEISKPLTKIKFSKIIWDYWWWLTIKTVKKGFSALSKPAFRLVVSLPDFHFHISWKLHARLLRTVLTNIRAFKLFTSP